MVRGEILSVGFIFIVGVAAVQNFTARTAYSTRVELAILDVSGSTYSKAVLKPRPVQSS